MFHVLLSRVADELDQIGQLQAHASQRGVAELLKAGISGPKRLRRSDPLVRATLCEKRKLASHVGNLCVNGSTTPIVGHANADVDAIEMPCLHHMLLVLPLR